MGSVEGQTVRVLVVEDDALFARLVCQIAREAGAEIIGPARSVADALRLAEDNPPDLALLDVSLNDGTGLEVAEVLVPKGTRCAMLTGHSAPKDPDGVAREVEWIDKLDGHTQIIRLLGEFKSS